MATKVTDGPSARERLLAAANELFYEEGVHTVGIDRVIERAGVAKATLYSAFGSKDELICAYLRDRHDARRAAIEAAMRPHVDPRDRALAVFDAITELLGRPGYHGCAFLNASAEADVGSPILTVTGEYRAWVRELFVGLATDLDVAQPDDLARKLALLYDGAGISGRMDGALDAGVIAKSAAAALIDAARAN